MERIVIFTGNADYTVRKGLAVLIERFPEAYFLVLLHKPRKSLRRIARNQYRNLRRNGWRWIVYQSAEIIDIVRHRWQKTLWHSETHPRQCYESRTLFDNGRVVLHTTENVHSAASIRHVRAFNPDLGLSLAAPILKAPLFELPRLGTLNLHKGKLPHYRGMPPAFWEFFHNESSVGCTIHKVAKGLDTGDILLEDAVARQRYSTVRGMRLALDELGIRITCDAVAMMAQNNVCWRPQPEGGQTFTKPTLKQQAAITSRERATKNDSTARRWIKRSVANGYLWGYRPLYRRLTPVLGEGNEVVVLLYHRVNDELRDSVTVGVEQFDQQMAYLARHYPIASIEDIVQGRLPQSTGSRPVVAVTFDDGYLDNYENAVPILLRHDIPAAFFVSTDMIGQARGFEHDINKLGRALPNMTWDHVREMHKQGFTIGSHTVSHMNCAKANGDALRNELSASRDRLVSELGLDEVIFAYPFGKRRDMTPEALERVKEAGYVACLSAFGGVNRGALNRFNVLRMGVDFNFGPRRFAARVEGW